MKRRGNQLDPVMFAAVAAATCCAACTGMIDPSGAPGGGDNPGTLTSRIAPPGNAPPGNTPPGTTPPAAATKPGVCQPTALVESPLRRLTRTEYNNTVADLLGDTTLPAKGFAPELGTTGFDTSADALLINDDVVGQYVTAGEGIAKRVTPKLTSVMGCDPASRGEDVCAKDFIATFGRRAFRRPLTAEEKPLYEKFYTDSKATYGFATAMEMVLRVFLNSPQLLYRIEIGAGAGPSTGLTRLTSHEMSTRLSYFFWATTPDETLLAAADRGELSTPTQIAAQAKRLLADKNGGRLIRNFYSQWMGTPGLALASRGADLTPALVDAMQQETATYFDLMIREKNATWADLLTSPISFMNGDLAKLYGIGGVTGADFREVYRPADRYRGFLTQAAFATQYAHPKNDSPIHRGLFLRNKVLCEPFVAPPANVVASIQPADATFTARQQLEKTTQTVDPCQICHSRINPPGYAFGNFDQMGRFSDNDTQGRNIDTAGTLTGTDVDGPSKNHIELIDRLARSDSAQACVVTQWMRYTLGRDDGTNSGDCRGRELITALQAANGNIGALLLKLATTTSFLYKETP